jgi:TPR repeat protein
MPHDVFISYSNRDKTAADAVCHALESARIRVWMAPRDILPGVGWAQSIIDAINGARVMVLVFSGNANGSPQIEREVERAVHKGIPVVPMRIEDVSPSAALEFFISAPHWLDAFPPPPEQHLKRLADAVRRLLESGYVRASLLDDHPKGSSEVNSELASVPADAPREGPASSPVGKSSRPETEKPALVAPPTKSKSASRTQLMIGAAVAAGIVVAVLGWRALDQQGLWSKKADVPTVLTEQSAFEEAMAANTLEALDAFTKKYPDSLLAKTAKRERERLQREQADSKRTGEQKGEKITRAGQAAPATECDRLAGDPEDPGRIASVEAVDWSNLDTTRAIAACDAALRSYPNDTRLSYEYGRVLQKAERYEEARKAYKIAADAGSAIAENNLGNLLRDGSGGPKDLVGATRLFRKSAEADDTWGIVHYADALSDGRGIEKNEAEAVRLYRKAADRGNSTAFTDLAYMLANGFGVTQDYAEALRLLRKAADAGNRTAMRNLGNMYRDGTGVPRDEIAAVRFYRKAVDEGDTGAMNLLGDMYLKGLGVKKDAAEAMRLYRRAADAGDAWGMNSIGNMYYSGEGVPQDDAEAARWYRKAVEANSPAALSNLADMYADGRGVAKDEAEAVRLYRKAVEGGNAYGMNMLGNMYFNGRGVAKDDVEAVRLYRMAVEAGNSSAASNLGNMYRDGRGVAKDFAEAVRLYRKAADAGYARGWTNLGSMFASGRGVAKDEAEAVQLYQKAAKANDTWAFYYLGGMYRDGRGVARDPVKARKYFQIAADRGDDDAKDSLKRLEEERQAAGSGRRR